MKKLQTSIMVAVLVFGLVGFANAFYFGPNPDFGNVENLLGNATYFNGYADVNSFDFEGEWNYTAIAFEAADTNFVQEISGGSKTFSTADPSNFGQWDQIDFSGDEPNNLKFKDLVTGYQRALDEYKYNDHPYIDLFVLTEDSNVLDWISEDFYLSAGTIIAAWNDDGSTDKDYDDIIVALKPVPEPGTIILLGLGLIGVVGLRRKNKK